MDKALDDIIAAGRKGGRRGGGGLRRGGGGAGRRSVGGGGGGRIAGGVMFTKSVPGGRWKHDKFNEIYGGAGNGAATGPRRRSGGGLSARFAKPVGRRTASGAPGDIVKLNISNLAETVVTSDLEELFEAYKVLGVTVHYDEGGNHLGTADVFLNRRTAEQIISDFTGVAIDGREMKIFVVDETNAAAIPARASLSERLGLRRTQSNPIRRRVEGRRSGGGQSFNNLDRLAPTRGSSVRRRGGGGGGAKRGAANGGAKTKLSADELDKELESYMGSKKHNRISMDL